MAIATLGPMLRRLALLATLAVAVAAVTAPPALAAGSSAIADCNAHGRLTQSYSTGQLQTALATMPADVQEYTNCYAVIHNQLLAEIPGHHTTAVSDSSGGGSFISTPLLVALIVLVVGGAALAGVSIQRRGGPSSGT